MIRIIKSSNLSALRSLRSRLSIDRGLVTSSSTRLTKKVFGKPLSPGEVVKKIITDVRKSGDKAVTRYERLLDRATIPAGGLRVPASAIRRAVDNTPAGLLKTLRKASANILRWQKKIRYSSKQSLRSNGLMLELNVTPLESAGIYVPGGMALYPSSVLMCVLPAKAAGVRRIIMATPPSPEGKIDDRLLAAASVCGVTEIYKAGGAQALAAMAFGTETIPRVCKIAGPGNIFVALAKKELYGQVDIDMIAGPSEVLIIADDSADPAYIAMDLMAQAEHYPGSAILVTTCSGLVARVKKEIAARIRLLSRGTRIAEDLKDFSLIVTAKNLEEACEIADDFAPEHLQIMTRNAGQVAKRIRNAGAIFVGPFTPVAVGDYFAGPSHTLPTGGTAKFFSGVNVNDFLKTSAVITAQRSYIKKNGKMIELFAEAEGLTAHRDSVRMRRL